MIPTFEEIKETHKRIEPYIHRTPVMSSESINHLCGAEIYFKCENLQKVGAFKFRGATNAVRSLDDKTALKGVATHSSGNHAQALALAARMRGIKAHIVMPSNSPKVKKKAVEGYGAEITFCEPTLQARERTLENVIQRTGAEFVHPYNDPRVIAGQGTAAIELIEKIGKPDIIMAPVGGGGLLSGTCISTKAISPETEIVAGEPEGADDAYRSLKAGKIIPSIDPDTICDGLLTSLGNLTFNIISKNVNKIITVDDDTIITAMRLVWERMKLIIEPSAAVCLAAIMKDNNRFKGKKVGIIISGGNIDLAKISQYFK